MADKLAKLREAALRLSNELWKVDTRAEAVSWCAAADEVLRAFAAAPQASGQQAEPTDEQLIALNAGERFFSESPTKYPEAGHGTQYHAGAPGVVGFARAAIALAGQQSERPAMTDSELLEHLHARGWNVGTIDVPMIREACKALQPSASAEPAFYVRDSDVEALADRRIAGRGAMLHKDAGEGRTAYFAHPPVSAAREQEASATGAEPAAWQERQQTDHFDGWTSWYDTNSTKVVGKTEAFEVKSSGVRYQFRPLFTYRHLREYGAIARQQGRDEMREWNASRVRDEALEALSEERLYDIADSDECNPDKGGWGPQFDFLAFARAIEAAHGIGTPKSAEGEGE